jgi:hypothetical protein
MTKQYVYLPSFGEHNNANVTAWLKANDLDIEKIVADQTMEIDGTKLHYNSFVTEDFGRKRVIKNKAYVQEKVTATMRVRPDDYGVTVKQA